MADWTGLGKAALALAIAGALTVGPPAPASGAVAVETFVAVDTAQRLLTFSGRRPEAARRRAIRRLPRGEVIVGLDVRPYTQAVFALGASSRLYRIDVLSGGATPVGREPFTPALVGGDFGFDFDPATGLARVVSDSGQNLGLDPDSGTVVAVERGLPYAAGDSGAGETPAVGALAYRSPTAGSLTPASLMAIDVRRDALLDQAPSGALRTLSSLGRDVASPVSMDAAAGTTRLYAASRRPGRRGSVLIRIELPAGRARAMGRIRGRTVRAMAVRGTVVVERRRSDRP